MVRRIALVFVGSFLAWLPAGMIASPASAATHLGGLNLDIYCAAVGVGHAESRGPTADAWFCVDGRHTEKINMMAACKQIYSPDAIARTPDYWTNGGSWQCWSTSGASGNPNGLNLDDYCHHIGKVGSKVSGSTVYSWFCTGPEGDISRIDMTNACRDIYGPAAIDRFRYFYDPYSWECWV
jgi:hypothetical protein